MESSDKEVQLNGNENIIVEEIEKSSIKENQDEKSENVECSGNGLEDEKTDDMESDISDSDNTIKDKEKKERKKRDTENKSIFKKYSSKEEEKKEPFNEWKREFKQNDSDSSEQVEQLKDNIMQNEMLKNFGTYFKESMFQSATFNFYNHKENDEKKEDINIDERSLCDLMDNEDGLSLWFSKHFNDYYYFFIMALSLCNKEPYNKVCMVAERFMNEFVNKKKSKKKSKINEPISKYNLVKKIGMIEYKDFLQTVGGEMEVGFVRYPLESQAYKIFNHMISNYQEVCNYLYDLFIKELIYTAEDDINHSMFDVSIRGLTCIGMIDIQYLMDRLGVLIKRNDEVIDYIVAIVFYSLHSNESNKNVILNYIKHWGKIKNNIHYPLISLNTCALIMNQEIMSYEIYLSIFHIIKEEMDEKSKKDLYYFKYFKSFYSASGRVLSTNIGYINAHYYILRDAEEKKDRHELENIKLLFYFLLMDEFERFNNNHKSKDMIFISIYMKLSLKLRERLTYLWVSILSDQIYCKDLLNQLDYYMQSSFHANVKEEKKLYMFFSDINELYKGNRIMNFLANCSNRTNKKVVVAKKIYKYLMEEKRYV